MGLSKSKRCLCQIAGLLQLYLDSDHELALFWSGKPVIDDLTTGYRCLPQMVYVMLCASHPGQSDNSTFNEANSLIQACLRQLSPSDPAGAAIKLVRTSHICIAGCWFNNCLECNVLHCAVHAFTPHRLPCVLAGAKLPLLDLM